MDRTTQAMLLLSLGGAVAAADNVPSYPNNACTALAEALPGNVAYPNSTTYLESNSYWSNRQAEVHPYCFVTPKSTDEVSTAMKILTSQDTPFTVKSGGHTTFAGGSNIADGVVIDLVHMNTISVSSDRKTVSVGPGNRWIDVFQELDPLELAVVGGRVADVGVGGLILGGGISYFSGQKGWACDNVRNFEVVVASGQVVNASPMTNKDLYWALRGGGGSNFGIVTRFDLASFEQGKLWTQSVVFPGALNGTLIPLFQDLAINGLPADPEAHTYFVLSFQPSFGGYVALTSFYHSTPPSPPDSIPEVFSSFQAVPAAVLNSTMVADISTHSKAIDVPYGSRQTWWDTTVSLASADLLKDIVAAFEARNAALFAAANGSSITPFLVFQPISMNILEAMQQNGGNALGLEPSDGPLTIVQITATWDDASLDALVEDSSRELIAAVEKMAEKRNLGNGFVYMNYAGSTQRVQRRYGKNNERKLKRVVREWDPQGHLARLWRGYFKVEE